MKKYCTCPNCGEDFELRGASRDELGWHTVCPKCDCSFDIDVEDYVVSNGTLIELNSGERGYVNSNNSRFAREFDEILYGIVINGATKHSKHVQRNAFKICQDWRKTRRNEYGGVERVCHYPRNQEWGNVPCYNCVDRTKCNADIFERLAQYEDTGLTPELVAEYKKFEDELVASGFSFKEVLRLIEEEKARR